MTVPGPSQTLLGRVAASDPDAVRECIDSYAPLVWAIARRFGPSLEEAQNSAQDAFRELWVRAREFDATRHSEPAFVAMVARRRMIERIRAIEPRPVLRPVPESVITDVGFRETREASVAEAVLATLDPRQRRVLSLAVGQGMTHAEVAAITAIDESTVKSLVRKALVAVRKRLLAATENGGHAHG